MPVASPALSPSPHRLERWRARIFRNAPADGTGVRLDHSRIYILPTRRGLALIATITTILVTSINYGLALGFALAFLLTGLVGAALLHTFRNLSSLRVAPGASTDAFAGGHIDFRVALDGGGRMRIAISIAAREKRRDARSASSAPAASSAFPPTGGESVVDVEAGTPAIVTLEVQAPQRGRVPLGRITIASTYPLGLWRAWSYAHFPVSGIAYPAPEPAAPPLPADDTGVDSAANASRGDADLSGLRDYQHGDPPQRIAWKAVARGAGWYAKAFEGSGGGGVVRLDLAALPARLTLEQKLSRLCAWVLICEREARPYALTLPRARIATGQGRDHRRAVLTALALVEEDGR